MHMPPPLLRVRDLRVNFHTYAGVVKALDGVSFEINRGEAFGLVGETGCGKSVTAASILRLIDEPGKIVGGEILFKGEDLLKKSEEEMRKVRGGRIAIVFQDPMTYLNPLLTIGDQIAEAVLENQDLTALALEIENKAGKTGSSVKPSRTVLNKAALVKVEEILHMVRMPKPERVVTQFPHELSGGMRQRAMIAMAISCNPELMILDEATTFLDVTIQRQILDLVKELQTELGCALLIITHDMGIVAETCERVAIMYAGNIVECGGTKRIFNNPIHPYTRGLLSAIPTIAGRETPLNSIPGFVPNLIDPPPGCRFHPRCPEATEICSRTKPELVEAETNHLVACHQHPSHGGRAQ
jgi:oligopeptide/dipeptide ABC transporter ATP-binding protein